MAFGRRLSPVQISGYLRLRFFRMVLPRLLSPSGQRPQAAAQWPRGFRPSTPRVTGAEANEVGRGVFEFLGEKRDVGGGDWRQSSASLLWRYELHSFEWAWLLLSLPEADRRPTFTRLYRSWRRSTRFGRWVEWAPYPASLRAWTLCALFEDLVSLSDAEPEVIADLRLHAWHASRNLETHQGGNHLIKNLKALLGTSAFFGERSVAARWLTEFARALGAQLYADGGHAERSPAYHAQVLQDAIDVRDLSSAMSLKVPQQLNDSIAAMTDWLNCLRLQDGTLPRFGDGMRPCEVPAAPVTPELVREARLRVLSESGFARADAGPFTVLMTFGPTRLISGVLPGHMHADCLSFELLVNGQRVLVDLGSSVYRAGPLRQWERSTRAHNTVTIDDADQSEMTASFRVGRLASGRLIESHSLNGSCVVTASHDGYAGHKGSPVHFRTWSIDNDGVRLVDTIRGSGSHEVRATFHFSEHAKPSIRAGRVTAGPIEVVFDVAEPAGRTPEISEFTDAEASHGLAVARHVECVLRETLPIVLVTKIRLMDESDHWAARPRPERHKAQQS